MKYHTLQQQQASSKVSERRGMGGSPVLPSNMDDAKNGTMDDLHNQPQPVATPRRWFGNAGSTNGTVIKGSNSATCNKSDPFCNGTL